MYTRIGRYRWVFFARFNRSGSCSKNDKKPCICLCIRESDDYRCICCVPVMMIVCTLTSTENLIKPCICACKRVLPSGDPESFGPCTRLSKFNKCQVALCWCQDGHEVAQDGLKPALGGPLVASRWLGLRHQTLWEVAFDRRRRARMSFTRSTHVSNMFRWASHGCRKRWLPFDDVA